MTSSHPPAMHTEHLRLRWGEMDAMRHLNNVSYFRYFEQARISWFDALGFDAAGDTEGPVLGSISCRFVKPALYPCDVVVVLWPTRIGNSSFTMGQQMRRDGGDGDLYADGEATMVWIDIATGRSRPLPQSIRDGLQASASKT
jgi:acyl-CoA thioester hydrolase